MNENISKIRGLLSLLDAELQNTSPVETRYQDLIVRKDAIIEEQKASIEKWKRIASTHENTINALNGLGRGKTINDLSLKIDDLQQTLAEREAQEKSLREELSALKSNTRLTRVIKNDFSLKQRQPNIAVIIGHDQYVQGAFSPFLNKTEWQYYKEQTETYVMREGGPSVAFFYRDRRGVISAHEEILGYEKVWGTKFDFVLEFHFNAFEKPSAKGAEILTRKTLYNAMYAVNALDKWTKENVIYNRGFKFPQKDQRGHFNVNNLPHPTFLIEPFFGTNEYDCSQVKNVEVLKWWIDEMAAQWIKTQENENV